MALLLDQAGPAYPARLQQAARDTLLTTAAHPTHLWPTNITAALDSPDPLTLEVKLPAGLVEWSRLDPSKKLGVGSRTWYDRTRELNGLQRMQLDALPDSVILTVVEECPNSPSASVRLSWPSSTCSSHPLPTSASNPILPVESATPTTKSLATPSPTRAGC